eukprot:Pgem_evm1s3015
MFLPILLIVLLNLKHVLGRFYYEEKITTQFSVYNNGVCYHESKLICEKVQYKDLQTDKIIPRPSTTLLTNSFTARIVEGEVARVDCSKLCGQKCFFTGEVAGHYKFQPECKNSKAKRKEKPPVYDSYDLTRDWFSDSEDEKHNELDIWNGPRHHLGTPVSDKFSLGDGSEPQGIEIFELSPKSSSTTSFSLNDDITLPFYTPKSKSTFTLAPTHTQSSDNPLKNAGKSLLLGAGIAAGGYILSKIKNLAVGMYNRNNTSPTTVNASIINVAPYVEKLSPQANLAAISERGSNIKSINYTSSASLAISASLSATSASLSATATPATTSPPTAAPTTTAPTTTTTAPAATAISTITATIPLDDMDDSHGYVEDLSALMAENKSYSSSTTGTNKFGIAICVVGACFAVICISSVLFFITSKKSISKAREQLYISNNSATTKLMAEV